MASTNKTTYYNLPQFIASDKPAWLVDFNGAMNDIDIAIHEVAESLGGVEDNISGLQSSVNTLETNVSGLQSSVNTLETNVSGLQSNVSELDTNVNGLDANLSSLQDKVNELAPNNADGLRQIEFAIGVPVVDGVATIDLSDTFQSIYTVTAQVRNISSAYFVASCYVQGTTVKTRFVSRADTTLLPNSDDSPHTRLIVLGILNNNRSMNRNLLPYTILGENSEVEER